MGINIPESHPAKLVNKAPQIPPTALSLNNEPHNKPNPINKREVKAVTKIASIIPTVISRPHIIDANRVIVTCAIVIIIIGKVYPNKKSEGFIGDVNKRIKKDEVLSLANSIPANKAINAVPNIA